MKKWLVLSFVLLNLMGCSDKNSKEVVEEKPPKVLIKLANETYETKLGTYCWSDNKVNTCVDMAGPVELLADKKPIEALPGEKVTLKMDYEPKPNEMHVTQFNANEKNKETEIHLRDNQFTVPKEKGIYYYAYSAGWTDEKDASVSKGDALYAFVLEVN
ncbi:hypothetical protein [Peribacillus sp. NPDC097295]|uniref:hypothetical protein n=1 Tax=Peribacillus sp. NPDC097295 TaxID=3364402 RepID=UPI0038287E1D